VWEQRRENEWENFKDDGRHDGENAQSNPGLEREAHVVWLISITQMDLSQPHIINLPHTIAHLCM
jgi:hypothetical protein